MRRMILILAMLVLAAPLWATGELRHSDVGAQISKAEWEATDTHYVVDGVTGDLLYVDAAGLIKRLAIGTEGYMLAVNSGLPSWAESIAADATGTTFTGTARMTSVTITETLGVGITTPTELVHVEGNLNDDVSLIIVNTGNSTLTQAVLAVRSGDTLGAFAAIDDSYYVAEKPGWPGRCILQTSTETLGLTLAALSSTGTITFATGGYNLETYERARFDCNGRFGIGTTTPARGLDLVGTDATASAFGMTRYENNAYGPNLYLVKDRAGNAGQNEDYCGYLAYRTRNSSSTMVNFAEIRAMAEDVTTGSEDGRLMIHVQKAGAPSDIVTVYTTGTYINGVCKATSFEGSGASGDVVGPASATANGIARYNGTTGKLIKSSTATLSDANAMAGLASVTATTVVVDALIQNQTPQTTGATYSYTYTKGTVQSVRLDQNITINDPSSTIFAGTVYYLIIKQPAGANYTVTWNAAFKWPAATAPTMTATNGTTDIYAFTITPSAVGSIVAAWRVAADVR